LPPVVSDDADDADDDTGEEVVLVALVEAELTTVNDAEVDDADEFSRAARTAAELEKGNCTFGCCSRVWSFCWADRDGEAGDEFEDDFCSLCFLVVESG